MVNRDSVDVTEVVDLWYPYGDIEFRRGVMEIPTLVITETMEARWRNFIAWEHHKKKWNKSSNDGGGDVFTFYALLFNDLICCTDDVQLLKNKGIIRDELGMRKRDLVHLFGSITNGVDRCLVDSSYRKMIDDLNNYSADLNNYSAIIHAVRFPIIVGHDLSRITERLYGLHKFIGRGYNFAAALITLLTIIQTCYAVLSYHYPKHN
ncbi:UPF0481 protein [Spatholobus suberectus]|nr:UPF0481 protein [Spatholobus suberectus]